MLHLKVDDSNRAQYERVGSVAFVPYPDKPAMTMPYYNVPAGVLEHAETLAEWAMVSVAVAKRARTKKGNAARSSRGR